MNYRARLDATAEAVEAAALARINELESEVAALKRSRDLAVMRMQESTAYCIELRERLNKYEPGAPMILNAQAPAR